MKVVFASALLATTLFLGVAPAMAASNICIDTRKISSQKTENHGGAILFRMQDGSQYRNTLRSRCPDLVFEGFVWTVRNPDNTVCDNQNTIRTLSGQTCMLGKFEQVKPANNG